VPLGVWHATTSGDAYRGWFIPKGTTVVANLWAMSRDEASFPNAEYFVPERYLNDDGMLNENNPMDFEFGFGRRICPGRHAADASLFISIVTMLATLEFHAHQDGDVRGDDLDLASEVKWVNGITHRPESFPCRISPRRTSTSCIWSISPVVLRDDGMRMKGTGCKGRIDVDVRSWVTREGLQRVCNWSMSNALTSVFLSFPRNKTSSHFHEKGEGEPILTVDKLDAMFDSHSTSSSCDFPCSYV